MIETRLFDLTYTQSIDGDSDQSTVYMEKPYLVFVSQTTARCLLKLYGWKLLSACHINLQKLLYHLRHFCLKRFYYSLTCDLFPGLLSLSFSGQNSHNFLRILLSIHFSACFHFVGFPCRICDIFLSSNPFLLFF